jgi:hypothetical protein
MPAKAPAVYTSLADLDAATSAATTDSVLLQTGELLPISILRKTLDGGSVIFVPPSGDTTGATDAAAIQAAINALETSTPAFQQTSAVLLSGLYYVNATITLGAENAHTDVSLHGIGVAAINMVQAAADHRYVIKVYGTSHGTKCVLSNLMLWCSYKCRGILLTSTYTKSVIQNIEVRQSIESAIDMIDCWDLNFYSITVQDFRGYGMRTRDANACHFDSVLFFKGYAVYSTNTGTVTDVVANAYGNANAVNSEGIAAAIAHYTPGLVLASPWPTATVGDETECTSLAGAAFVTPDAERSVLRFHGQGSTFTSLQFENCYTLEYPLIYAKGGGRSWINSMYCEANMVLKANIICDGASYLSVNQINMQCGNGSPAAKGSSENNCECFLRCVGTTKGNRVNRLTGYSGIATDGHIVLLDGGTHTGTTCVECATTESEIATAEWIGEVNSPTVSATWDDTY